MVEPPDAFTAPPKHITPLSQALKLTQPRPTGSVLIAEAELPGMSNRSCLSS